MSHGGDVCGQTESKVGNIDSIQLNCVNLINLTVVLLENGFLTTWRQGYFHQQNRVQRAFFHQKRHS